MFGEGLETSGTALVDEVVVVDERTKPEPAAGGEEGGGENNGTQGEGEGEGDKSGEGVAKTAEELAAEKETADNLARQEQEETREAEALKKLLEKYGVANEEELANRLNPKQELSEEEKLQKEETYKASLAKFAIDNKVFSNDDWLQYHNVIKMPDNDLVFNDFASNYREAHKDRLGDENQPDPVTDDELRDKFNELYSIDSENPGMKKIGADNMQRHARELRAELQSKYDDVKSVYDKTEEQRQATPVFKKFFQEVMNSSIPASLTYGEGDKAVNFELSQLDKQEFEKSLIKTIGGREFEDYMAGKGTTEQRDRIAREVKKELLFMNHEAIAAQNYEAGLSAGKKAGAKGSSAAFVEQEKMVRNQEPVKVSAEDKAKVKQAFN